MTMSRETPDGFRIGGPWKFDDTTEDWDDEDDDDFEPDFDDDTYLRGYSQHDTTEYD